MPGIGSRYWDIAGIQFMSDFLEINAASDSANYEIVKMYNNYTHGFMQAYENEFGERTDPRLVLPGKLAYLMRRIDLLKNKSGQQDSEINKATGQLMNKYKRELALSR